MDSGEARVRRRELLIAGAGAGLALAAPINYAAIARAGRRPLARTGRFASGVASGLPTPRAITLWTKLEGIDQSSRLRLEVAEDRGFSKVVRETDVVASRRQGFTARARVGGLRPHEQYFYRFATAEKSSPVGRFRTAPPPDSRQRVRIGFFSCQDWNAGFYNAQLGLAREPDLDLVICLGDYMYETAFYGDDAVRRDRTGDNNDGDVQKLREYREKYALYRSDRNLRAMHAAHPFVAIWDDHEVEDNYAGDDPDEANGPRDQTKTGGGTGPRRVPFLQRRRNGYRAFFESMPRYRMKKDLSRIYGSVRLGRLCELFLLDQRQYRDPQPCDDELFNPCPEYAEPRTMLGAAQKRWLKRNLAESGATWKVLANQLVMMSLDAVPGQHLNPDQWDGYQVERQEILEHVVANDVDNVVAVTGDIHTFFAGTVTTTGNSSGTPAATEFVGGSATSLGIPEATGIPPATLATLAASNQHVEYYEFERRGYGVLELGRSGARCTLKAVDARARRSKPQVLKRFTVQPAVPGPQDA